MALAHMASDCLNISSSLAKGMASAIPWEFPSSAVDVWSGCAAAAAMKIEGKIHQWGCREGSDSPAMPFPHGLGQNRIAADKEETKHKVCSRCVSVSVSLEDFSPHLRVEVGTAACPKGLDGVLPAQAVDAIHSLLVAENHVVRAMVGWVVCFGAMKRREISIPAHSLPNKIKTASRPI